MSSLSITKIAGSGAGSESDSQKYGFADPDTKCHGSVTLVTLEQLIMLSPKYYILMYNVDEGHYMQVLGNRCNLLVLKANKGQKEAL